MAVTTPIMYNGMYCGNMTEQQIQLILNTREQAEIPNLRKMIYNFPPEIIKQSIDEFKSPREIVLERGEKLEDYLGELRKYQTVGTAFMYFVPRCILADGVGLGKTCEIAALVNLLKAQGKLTKFLLGVETSAISQSQFEMARFTGLNIIALPSEGVKMRKVINNLDWRKVDGIVIKHSTLRSDVFSKWLSLNLDENGMCKIFNTFFFDESSVIKNPETKMSIYTKNICNIVERVHMMNATAFETSILDVYYQIDMMNDGLLPKKWRIEKEFCTFGRTSYWTKENGKAKLNWRHERNGYKNQEKFKESLKLFYFGRCKKDIGMDMPHIYKVYEVEPSNDQAMALAQGHRYMDKKYKKIIACIMVIFIVFFGYSTISKEYVEDINIPMTRKTVPKLERLCQLVENEFADSSVMIYCFHLAAQEAIAEEMRKIGRKPITLNGACKDEERFAAQQGFNNGTYDVIITNIKKSLNLYGGDVCIFYSMETNIAKMEQIRGRIDRNVDDKVKTFVMLLYKGTDEYKFFTTVVGQRAKDSRDLTIDAETAADWFMAALNQDQESGDS